MCSPPPPRRNGRHRSNPLAWARAFFFAAAVAPIIGGVGVVRLEHASTVSCGGSARFAIHGSALGNREPRCVDPIDAGRAREMAVDLGYTAVAVVALASLSARS